MLESVRDLALARWSPTFLAMGKLMERGGGNDRNSLGFVSRFVRLFDYGYSHYPRDDLIATVFIVFGINYSDTDLPLRQLPFLHALAELLKAHISTLNSAFLNLESQNGQEWYANVNAALQTQIWGFEETKVENG